MTAAPPLAALLARADALPLGFPPLARWALTLPGLTGAHLLLWADAIDRIAASWPCAPEAGADRAAGCRGWLALAALFRDAAPALPDPPRLPASAGPAAPPPPIPAA